LYVGAANQQIKGCARHKGEGCCRGAVRLLV